MTESLFRVGGVYRDECGRVQRLSGKDLFGGSIPEGVAWAQAWIRGDWVGDGFRSLLTGIDQSCFQPNDDGKFRHLQPGELTFVDGEWISMTPTLDKLEAEKESLMAGVNARMSQRTHEMATQAIKGMVRDPNAAMIARDGPAKPAHCVCGNRATPNVFHRTDGPCFVAIAEGTAKPPLPALTRMSAGDHRFGLNSLR